MQLICETLLAPRMSVTTDDHILNP